MAKFRDIIIPGRITATGIFSFVDFPVVEIEIPEEFLAAAWGYGRQYGMYYGMGV